MNLKLALGFLIAVTCSGSSCGGGGGGGGGPQPTPDTTKPTITKVEYTPKNPVLGQAFQGKADGSDDKDAISELEVEVTIDTDNDGDFSDETPVTQKDISNAVTLTLPNNLSNGKYNVRIALKDKSGNAASTAGTFYTNPHSSYVIDGSLKDNPTLSNPNAGILLKYVRRLPFYQGMLFGQQLGDLDTILGSNALTSTESLLEFVLDQAGKITLKVKDTAQNGYANGTWGGDVSFGQLVVGDTNRYLTEVITSTEAVSYAAYFRNFNPTNPTAVGNSFAGAPNNPMIADMYANQLTVIPGVGTLTPDLIIEYNPVNGTALTLAVFFDPDAATKQRLSTFTPTQDYKVAILDKPKRADVDKALNNP